VERFFNDQRQRERIEILGDLHGEVMVFQPMTIREIGIGGALVETSFPLPLHSLHDIRLTLGDHSVVLKARVAHSRIGDVDQDAVKYHSGLNFTEPPAHVQTVIAQFIEALKDGRRKL
jgi:hypothetical protein